jgi:hypothetical protein
VAIALVAGVGESAAQFTNLPGAGIRLTNTSDKLGVGHYFNLTNPTSTLTVGGNISLYPLGATGRNIMAHTDLSTLTISVDQGSTTGPTLELYGRNHPRHGEMTFVSWGVNSGKNSFNFAQYDNVNGWWNTMMVMTDDGRLILGNGTPNTTVRYGLYVPDGILTERVKIALKNTADWSDYVFAPTYQLMSLRQLREYIAINKHLPDVPSADDVVLQGIDMAKMDATLLRKIEELTLYILELQERISLLEKKAQK